MHKANGVVLIILDGYGIAPEGPGNAISVANPPILNSLCKQYPHTILDASGEAVGLPRGETGSSEVGHVNIGAGRIVLESLARINTSIADGSFFKNNSFLQAINHVKKNYSNLHLIGLLGSSTIHACIDHLYALLFLIKEHAVSNVYLHVITDGRDSLPKSGITYIEDLQQHLDRLKIGKIATIMGRYYAMDRDHRWERIEKAYKCLTEGDAEHTDNINQYIIDSYKANITDEFIKPANVYNNGKPVSLIRENDSVIFYNFRVDRPRELTKAFVLENFEKDANITDYDPYIEKYYFKSILADDEVVLNPPFKRTKKLQNLLFVTMTQYEKNLPVLHAFPPENLVNTLGEIISNNELFQLRITESEKERFVTYYFNGFRKERFKKEDRLIIPSPKVATYDLKPEMSAQDIISLLVSKIQDKTYSFILANFANPDMVGHTGNVKAAVEAIKIIDACVEKLIKVCEENNYNLLITSDHGNVEVMLDPIDKGPQTSHDPNPVPLYIIHPLFKDKPVKLLRGILADIAPTILHLLNIIPPKEMTGRDLLLEM